MTDTTRPKVAKTDAEWRAQLTPEQYHITREHGTERPFTGPYLNEKRNGTYVCVSCGNPLFLSDTKYESGSGWPSFYAPASKEAVAEIDDRSLGMRRTEIRCAACGASSARLSGACNLNEDGANDRYHPSQGRED